MTTCFRFCLFLPLLGIPLALPAQQGPADAGRPAETRPAQHTQPSGPGLLLRHRTSLGLTDVQISRLERIARELEAVNRPLLLQLKEAGIPIHGHGRDKDRKLTPAEKEELRAKLEAHKPVLHQLQKNTRAAMEEAHGVLTSAQRDRLRAIMDGEPRSHHHPWDDSDESGLGPKKAPHYGD